MSRRRILMAEFATPERAVAALQSLKASGYRAEEAYAPFSSEKLMANSRQNQPCVRPIMFAAAVAGMVTGVVLQYWSAVIAYPINSGGRPLASWPAFVPVIFELTVLFAAVAGFIALLVEAGLTRLHADVFDINRFSRASQDRFFITVEATMTAKVKRLLRQAESLTAVKQPP
jgi:hypothetical protein